MWQRWFRIVWADNTLTHSSPTPLWFIPICALIPGTNTGDDSTPKCHPFQCAVCVLPCKGNIRCPCISPAYSLLENVHPEFPLCQMSISAISPMSSRGHVQLTADKPWSACFQVPYQAPIWTGQCNQGGQALTFLGHNEPLQQSTVW